MCVCLKTRFVWSGHVSPRCLHCELIMCTADAMNQQGEGMKSEEWDQVGLEDIVGGMESAAVPTVAQPEQPV